MGDHLNNKRIIIHKEDVFYQLDPNFKIPPVNFVFGGQIVQKGNNDDDLVELTVEDI
eukprot:UN05247